MATSSPESISSGTLTAVTTAERSSSGEKSSRPIALIPSRQARPRRRWRSKAASSPSSRISPSATFSPPTSDTAGVNAASNFACAVAHALPLEVVARKASGGRLLPGRLRDGDDGEPGRGHERLLRAGDDHVHAPRVGLERDGAQARDRVARRRARRRPRPTAPARRQTTPVEVSDWVMRTTDGAVSSMRSRRSSAEGVSPQS